MVIKEINDSVLWDAFVDSSPYGTLFHKWDFLEIIRKYSRSNLHRYGIYKGNSLIAIFPFFYGRMNIFKTLFSPPPFLLIPYLGFILYEEFNNLKQEKKESVLNEIISGLNEINKLYPSDYLSIILVPGIDDIREFIWSGYSVTPYYTYSVPMHQNTDEIFLRFSRDTCRVIRKDQNNDISIVKDNDLSELIENEKITYKKQGLKFPIQNLNYLIDIKNKYENNISIYKSINNNSITSSILMMEYKKAYAWIGNYKPEKGSNETFLWELIKLEKSKGYKELEIMGANTKHLCRFKSHFNPTLQLYFNIEKGNIYAQLAKTAKSNFKVL